MVEQVTFTMLKMLVADMPEGEEALMFKISGVRNGAGRMSMIDAAKAAWKRGTLGWTRKTFRA